MTRCQILCSIDASLGGHMRAERIAYAFIAGLLGSLCGVWVIVGHVPTRADIGLLETGIRLQIFGEPDPDGDGVRGNADNCGRVKNPLQENADGDPWGDVCDTCPTIPNRLLKDADRDGLGDECDNCPHVWNEGQEDHDSDGVGDACDLSSA